MRPKDKPGLKAFRGQHRVLLGLWVLAALAFCLAPPVIAAPNSPRFDVSVKSNLLASPLNGRLFVILSRTNSPEPRLLVTRPGKDAPVTLARDVSPLPAGSSLVLDSSAFTFPITNLSALAPDTYFVQALFTCNEDLRLPNAPGNLYSSIQKLQLDAANFGTAKVELTEQIPSEETPPDTEELKFIKIQSQRLSAFHHRPIYLRAGIILPRDYQREPDRRYPLWIRIGGFGSRYTVVNRLMHDPKEFRPTWLADDTPRFVLLQLDGAGPYGDPYYVNSANNGPYGNALVQELIPYVEQHFRVRAEPRARVLSGVSTGGWVALALQIFYPDSFNGAWASCPDPVDFRAFELVNLYEAANAYVDRKGQELPSERNLKGEVVLSVRREVGSENLLGMGDSYTLSGQQWGAWNAVYSPRGTDGLPMPAWDPRTGTIDHRVTRQWEKYDLRSILEKNWKTLGPKLRGKLHIASGEADQYYLNNAVHLLDDFLSHAKPPYQGSIVYGPGKGHGWSNLTLKQMLEQMQARAER